MQACASCTQPLPADATTCPSCGTAVTTSVPFTAGNVDPWGAAPPTANPPPAEPGATPPPLPSDSLPPYNPPSAGKGIPTWVKVLAGVVALIVVLGAAGAFFLVRAFRTLEPETIEGFSVTSDEGFTSFDDFDDEFLSVDGLDGLSIGDCLTTDGVPTPCSDSHEYEVFHILPMAGSAYPGFEEVFEASAGACTDAYEQYVGIDYFESEYFLDAYPSSEEAWQAGDQTISCVAYDPFGEITGSIRGVAR